MRTRLAQLSVIVGLLILLSSPAAAPGQFGQAEGPPAPGGGGRFQGKGGAFQPKPTAENGPPGGPLTPAAKDALIDKLFDRIAEGKDAIDPVDLPAMVQGRWAEWAKGQNFQGNRVTRDQFRAFMTAQTGRGTGGFGPGKGGGPGDGPAREGPAADPAAQPDADPAAAPVAPQQRLEAGVPRLIYGLANARAEELALILSRHFDGDAEFTVEATSNTLLIRARAAVLKNVEEVLALLDRGTDPVAVDVWQVEVQPKRKNGSLDGVGLKDGVVLGPAAGVAAQLAALASDELDVEVTRLHVATQDNQPGKVSLGREAAYVTGVNATTDANGAPITQRSVAYRSVGEVLQVTPTLGDDSVRLQMTMAVSSLRTAPGEVEVGRDATGGQVFAAEFPVTEWKSTLAVPPGQAVVARRLLRTGGAKPSLSLLVVAARGTAAGERAVHKWNGRALYPVRFAGAESLAASAENFLGPDFQVALDTDRRTNCLLIRAPERAMGEVLGLLQKLDRTPRQVAVTVWTVEVKGKDGAESLSGPAADVRAALEKMKKAGRVAAFEETRLVTLSGQPTRTQAAASTPVVAGVSSRRAGFARGGVPGGFPAATMQPVINYMEAGTVCSVEPAAGPAGSVRVGLKLEATRLVTRTDGVEIGPDANGRPIFATETVASHLDTALTVPTGQAVLAEGVQTRGESPTRLLVVVAAEVLPE